MSDFRSNSIKAKDVEWLPSDDRLAGIPDDLKSLTAFDELEQRLAKVMFSDHKHVKVKSFVNCKRCSQKMLKRREEIKKVGFKDYEQYLIYKKVMGIIKDGQKETV